MTASIVVVIKWTFIVFVTGFQECHKMKHEVIHLNIFKTCLNWKHWKYFLTRISAKSKTFSFLPQDTKDNSKLPRFSANHMCLPRDSIKQSNTLFKAYEIRWQKSEYTYLSCPFLTWLEIKWSQKRGIHVKQHNDMGLKH